MSTLKALVFFDATLAPFASIPNRSTAMTGCFYFEFRTEHGERTPLCPDACIQIGQILFEPFTVGLESQALCEFAIFCDTVIA
jgi:hypothetical protein